MDAAATGAAAAGVEAAGAEAAGPQWWGTAPPVVLELGLIAVLAAVLLGLAVRRFSRAD